MSGTQLITSVYEAFGRGDVPAVLAAMDPQIRWYEAEGNPYMPSGEAWVGPDAVVNNLFVKLGEDWDGFAVHPAAFHDAGAAVVVEGRYTGTHRGTGEALDAQFCHIWSVGDGRITKFQQYTNTAELQRATGA